ncbi:MAG TPA: SsrA-binding protein SmpB [Candidatus Saccharimonadales bacterium]|nr:SsrA-binding protein SmpB [Candidatus Saccharimonadales bacterium]
MAKKAKKKTAIISNRRARYDYELADSLIAGISLTGRETKSLRLGHGHLRGAYVTARNGELWLINATITSANGYTITPEDQTRPRKLLVKKRELAALLKSKDEGKTLVPLELLTKSRYIKLRLSIGKGKKRYDKRQSIKKREEARQTARELKSR